MKVTALVRYQRATHICREIFILYSPARDFAVREIYCITMKYSSVNEDEVLYFEFQMMGLNTFLVAGISTLLLSLPP